MAHPRLSPTTPASGSRGTATIGRMSPPAPAPDRRPHLDLRTAVIAVLIGALTLGGVVGGGLLAAGDTNYAHPAAVDYLYYMPPSDSWASGSTQQWSTTIDPGASIFTSADHLFSVKTDGDDTRNSTLTAYAMDDSGPSTAWTTTVDTTADSIATSGAKNNPVYPAFLIWGKNTLIHGTTLYDITTGNTTDAPWPTDAVPVVAGDTVVACQKTTCAGYREGDTTPAWSSAIRALIKGSSADATDVVAEISESGDNYATVHVLSGTKYVIIASRYVINISTGEILDFVMPEKNTSVYAITSTAEGWAILSVAQSSKEWHLSFYDVDGGRATSTHTPQRSPDGDQPMYFPAPRSVKDFQAVWLKNDSGSLAGTMEFTTDGSKDCAQKLSMTNAATIDLSGFDKNTFPCFDRVATQVSDKAKVVTTGMRQVTNEIPFSLMFDSATGERIAFEGLDPDNGAVFDVAAPKQIIGYSPADGTLIGYKPANG